tara:strand:+ start:112 stop:594 length:483 start_codon:yes stop_codon:yes gene_type:complete
MKLLDRLMSKTIKEGDCLLWVGSKNHKGYGKIRIGSRKDGTRKMVFTHRLSYELHNKEKLTKDILVCHSCDTPSCVNPHHLWAGTNSDNMKDMANKGRSARKHGEDNPCSKLTNKQVINILSSNEKGTVLAKRHGVSSTAVYHIRKGRSWNQLTKRSEAA